MERREKVLLHTKEIRQAYEELEVRRIPGERFFAILTDFGIEPPLEAVTLISRHVETGSVPFKNIIAALCRPDDSSRLQNTPAGLRALVPLPPQERPPITLRNMETSDRNSAVRVSRNSDVVSQRLAEQIQILGGARRLKRPSSIPHVTNINYESNALPFLRTAENEVLQGRSEYEDKARGTLLTAVQQLVEGSIDLWAFKDLFESQNVPLSRDIERLLIEYEHSGSIKFNELARAVEHAYRISRLPEAIDQLSPVDNGISAAISKEADQPDGAPLENSDENHSHRGTVPSLSKGPPLRSSPVTTTAVTGPPATSDSPTPNASQPQSRWASPTRPRKDMFTSEPDIIAWREFQLLSNEEGTAIPNSRRDPSDKAESQLSNNAKESPSTTTETLSSFVEEGTNHMTNIEPPVASSPKFRRATESSGDILAWCKGSETAQNLRRSRRSLPGASRDIIGWADIPNENDTMRLSRRSANPNNRHSAYAIRPAPWEPLQDS
mmetsp:Transcript_43365/g.70363  ORF Transcript_43365/g.70363 Transcript_43365/m.70363 type:complete len:496 (-) Transcript_43365:360-1847(-)|eukprot:CAMPEP_0184668024 /NCGR_PEP_ID=MMETSP0308-20130426/70346_1 /TAXON_ID=38269 /ORGANISM="Gloeochaete witrockiana, Strain SAG 46.84" /LENGTH=495 /DNA_ID=CAMNT_0027113533 /DNA_START=163 /DNA_END=1650 /DNA_ORIENTATION=-